MKLRRQRSQGPLRGLSIQVQAGGQLTLTEHAEEECCIGRGGQCAPAPIAGRARLGTRALRAHRHEAADIDRRNRAPARTDRTDIDPRGLQRHTIHFTAVEDACAPVDDQAGIKARAAHVRRDQLAEPETSRELGGALGPSHGPGIDGLEGPLLRLGEGHRAPPERVIRLEPAKPR